MNTKPIPRWVAGDHHEGMSKGLARTICVLGFWCPAWAYLSTLCREIGGAFRYARLAAREEIATMGRIWTGTAPREPDAPPPAPPPSRPFRKS